MRQGMGAKGGGMQRAMGDGFCVSVVGHLRAFAQVSTLQYRGWKQRIGNSNSFGSDEKLSQ